MPIPKQKQDHGSVDIQLVDVNSIFPWKSNPRNNDQAVEPLARILQKHGQRSPVIVWRKNNVVYKGNTTLKAIKLLGWKMIKVQFEDFPSEAAATAYGIADNKSSEFSEWNDEILGELLTAEEIKEFLPSTGFTDEELRGLAMEPDIDKVDKLEKTETGIVATIKIQCKPEDRDEMRVLLTGWASECGFENVVVK